MRTKFAVLWAAVVLVTGLVVPSLASAHPQPQPALAGLRVLLTNDDSVQPERGTGLFELRKALCAAGADVLVVGPWGPQSGMGGRITTSGPVTVQAIAPPASYETDCSDAPTGGKVFGACVGAGPCVAGTASASPADTAELALTRFIPDNYWADGPSVVLSGINPGHNTAKALSHSGTVNAAVTAHDLDVPAIAFSEEVVMSCVNAGVDCPQFTGAADFAVELLAELRNERQLEPDLLLNVNFPNIRTGEKLAGPVLNVQGTYALLPGYTGTVGAEGGTYAVGVVDPRPETLRNAEQGALDANKISVVPLSGSWSFAPRIPPKLRHVIRSLS
jgi:5'-nucleotidase